MSSIHKIHVDITKFINQGSKEGKGRECLEAVILKWLKEDSKGGEKERRKREETHALFSVLSPMIKE